MADAGRILIVGGGIAGLSLAIALRRAGADPELVERSPTWPAAGAGIVLHANAVRALDALGVGEAIRAASRRSRAGGSSTSKARS
jgi:2-polyprenyl-6-methoxyphenol hydroxylase-like FAD-dependent oxidoreductase